MPLRTENNEVPTIGLTFAFYSPVLSKSGWSWYDIFWTRIEYASSSEYFALLRFEQAQLQRPANETTGNWINRWQYHARLLVDTLLPSPCKQNNTVDKKINTNLIDNEKNNNHSTENG